MRSPSRKSACSEVRSTASSHASDGSVSSSAFCGRDQLQKADPYVKASPRIRHCKTLSDQAEGFLGTLSLAHKRGGRESRNSNAAGS